MVTAAMAAAGCPLAVHENRQKFSNWPLVRALNARRCSSVMFVSVMGRPQRWWRAGTALRPPGLDRPPLDPASWRLAARLRRPRRGGGDAAVTGKTGGRDPPGWRWEWGLFRDRCWPGAAFAGEPRTGGAWQAFARCGRRRPKLPGGGRMNRRDIADRVVARLRLGKAEAEVASTPCSRRSASTWNAMRRCGSPALEPSLRGAGSHGSGRSDHLDVHLDLSMDCSPL